MMARKAPEKPEWPAECTCELCGELVYVVSSQDGDEVELDIFEMDVRPGCAESGERPTRRIANPPELRHYGGYRLLGPELFLGWPDDDDEESREMFWQWFAQRMTLAGAEASEQALHGEHFMTCRSVTAHARLRKVCNVAVTGDAAGDPLAKAAGGRSRARNLALQAQAEHDASSTQASPPPSPRRLAKPQVEDFERSSSPVEGEQLGLW